MSNIVYTATLAGLGTLAVFVPGARWWLALVATIATGIWLYFALRDTDFQRKDAVADLPDSAMVNFPDSDDVGEHYTQNETAA